MPEFIAVVHVYIQAPDEVTAVLSGEDLRIGIEAILDEDESVDVMEVIPADADPTPSATVLTLRRARNELIKTRVKEWWDLAREVDRASHIVQTQLASEDGITSYDWSKFLSVTTDVLNGRYPL